MNVWKTITLDCDKIVSHSPPLTRDELQPDDQVYVQTAIGLRRMTVCREPKPGAALLLVDDGCLGVLELDEEGYWFCGILLNHKSINKLTLTTPD